MRSILFASFPFLLDIHLTLHPPYGLQFITASYFHTHLQSPSMCSVTHHTHTTTHPYFILYSICAMCVQIVRCDRLQYSGILHLHYHFISYPPIHPSIIKFPDRQIKNIHEWTRSTKRHAFQTTSPQIPSLPSPYTPIYVGSRR